MALDQNYCKVDHQGIQHNYLGLMNSQQNKYYAYCEIVEQLDLLTKDGAAIKSDEVDATCKCKHPTLYHLFSTITNIETGIITPVQFCLECDCSKYVEE